VIRIDSCWRESPDGNLICGGGIGNINDLAFSILDESVRGPATRPKVVAEDLGDGRTKVTFLPNFGVTHIGGIGVFSEGMVACHNRDNVEMIVDLTP